jgi:hypothetical protein
VGDRNLVRLDVSDVDDPKSVGFAVNSKAHLLISLLELNGVNPLIVDWVTDIVEVLDAVSMLIELIATQF